MSTYKLLSVAIAAIIIMGPFTGTLGGQPATELDEEHIVGIPQTAPRSTFDDQQGALVLENGLIHLTFNKTFNGGLDSLFDPVAGYEFRPDKDMPPILFQLVIRNGTGRHLVSNLDADSFDYTGTNLSNGSSLELRYTGIDGIALNVTANIEVIDNDPRSYWNISVLNYNSTTAVLEAQYPVIWGLSDDIGGNKVDDMLAVPKLDGILYPDPYKKTQPPIQGNLRFGYPGTLSMQFMAFYDPASSGLHFETRDPEGNFKEFFFENSGPSDNVMAGITHHGPEVDGADLIVPYPSVLSFFEGSWYSSADLYKEWALEQAWTSEGRMADRTDVPLWLKSPSPVIMVENHDVKGNEVVPIEQWSDMVSLYNTRTGTNVTLFVRGWEGNGTFTGPFYLPPKDGADSVKDEVKEVLVAGGNVMFSISERLWRLKIPGAGYDGTADFNSSGSPYAVLDPNGEPVVDPSSTTLGIPGAVMDTSTSWWQDIVEGNSQGVAGLLVDGLMLEDSPVDAWVPCYNTSHGHDNGWGRYITDGHLATIEGAFNAGRAVNPDTYIGTDHPSELTISVSQSYRSGDSSPEISVQYLEDIHDLGKDVRTEPMFSYVYHPYLTAFGPVLDMDPSSGRAMFNSTARAIATDYVRGKLVTTHVNPSGLDDPLFLELFTRTAKSMATSAKDYIYLGDMLEPPVVDSPLLEIPYYDPFHTDTNWTSLLEEQVLNSAWMSQDGRVAHTLVNWANTSVDISFQLPDYHLTNENYSIIVTRNGEPITIEPSTRLPIDLQLTLNPRDVILVEVLRAPDIVVERMTVDPIMPIKGQDVNVTVEVANRGSIEMPIVNMFLYEDGVFFGNQTILLLGPDTNVTLTFVWQTAGRAPGQYNLSVKVWPRPEEISLTNNELSAVVDVLPVPVGHIRSTVIDNSTKGPLSGAELILFHPSNGTIVDLQVSQTSSDVLFEDLLPGTYAINATKSGYIPVEHDHIEVTPDNTTLVTLALDPVTVIEKFGDIDGLVLDLNTTIPIAGAMVNLVELNMTYYTSIDGAFMFQDIGPGNYTLRVTRHEYHTKVLQVQVLQGETAYINVEMTWIPPPSPKGDIIGVVLDKKAQTPIVGAVVRMTETSLTTSTNDTGGFSFDSISLGSHILNVTAKDFHGTDVEVDVLIEGVNIVTIHLEALEPPPPPKVSLMGYIKDVKELPIMAAQIKVQWTDCPLDNCTFKTYSDVDGKYKLSNLGPGELKVLVTAPGYVNHTYVLNVIAGGTFWHNVTLKAEKVSDGEKDMNPTITYILVALNLMMVLGMILLILTARLTTEKKGPRKSKKVARPRVKKKILDKDADLDEEITDDEE